MEQCMVNDDLIEKRLNELRATPPPEECIGCEGFLDKDRKDYTNEDLIEAVVYDLHQINTFSENAMNLLNELFGRIYDK